MAATIHMLQNILYFFFISFLEKGGVLRIKYEGRRILFQRCMSNCLLSQGMKSERLDTQNRQKGDQVPLRQHREKSQN